MPTIDEIFKCLRSLNLNKRFGIAGSYARGTAKHTSDIDIVVDTDMLDIQDIELIKKAIWGRFHKRSDVICLELLRQEDEELDNLGMSLGIGINDCSAYKTICRDVIWESNSEMAQG